MHGISPFSDALRTHAKLSLTSPLLSPVIGPTSSTLYITHSMDYLAQEFGLPYSLLYHTLEHYDFALKVSRTIIVFPVTDHKHLYHTFGFSHTRNLKSDYPQYLSTRCRDLVRSRFILVRIDKNANLMAESGPLDFVVSHTGTRTTWGTRKATMRMRQGHVMKLPGIDIDGNLNS